MNDTWIIIDANYLCHRARYSMGELSHGGSPTGVVFGFLQTVIALEEQFDTAKVAFCFDSMASKRQEIYPVYKANRKSRQKMTKQKEAFEREFHRQINFLRTNYLPKIGFRNIFFQSGYESDDLIAAACITAKTECNEIIIVTADQDLFQCIGGKVSVWNPQKQEMMTLQRFWQTYEIEPRQWAAVKTIAGCSSDNIKGAKGIGEKTALKFMQGKLNHFSKAYERIQQFLYSEVDRYMSSRLVSLPLPGTKTIQLQKDHIRRAGWISVCRQLGFKSLVGKVPRMQLEKRR
jgi:DNA polymerase-1